MQVIVNVKLSEIDTNLLDIIKELLSKNAEVVIKKESLKLEEYNSDIPLDKVMQDFAEAGYSGAFLEDLREGLKTSSVYANKQ
jgi:hypothetical protein